MNDRKLAQDIRRMMITKVNKDKKKYLKKTERQGSKLTRWIKEENKS